LSPNPADDHYEAERELLAAMHAQNFRRFRAASLRWAAVASVPVWLHAWSAVLPGLLAFWAALLQGGSLFLVAAFTVLEVRWGRRSAQIEDSGSPRWVHIAWRSWDEMRWALSYALALVSMVPWAYVAFARPVPQPLLSTSTAAAATVLVLLLVAETVLRLPLRRAGGGTNSSSGRRSTAVAGRRRTS
jgi:hypothetical protein